MKEPHNKLIEAVAQLDKGQRVKKAERSEPTIEVSEYHLVKSGIPSSNEVHPEDLAKSLGQKGHQHDITKKLRYVRQKCKVLPKPLEKPAAERIKRVVGFDETKKELGKWNGIIARNRTVDYLSFPLNHAAKIKNSPTVEFLKRFRLKSDLMKKLEEVDPSVQFPMVEEEKEENSKITMEEMILKRKQAARLRALQSYKEAKAHRQRKIKSKKFHRIQKKGKVKEQIKEFEELRKNNPEEALTKLEQLDKSRAEERMSLRHKSTGQWAKNKQIRAKYNKDSRQELAEQLAISRELTQKVKQVDDSDEEEEEEEEISLSKGDRENSCMNSVKTEFEVDELIRNYRKYWDEKHQEEKEQKVANGLDAQVSLEKEITLSENKSEEQISNKMNDGSFTKEAIEKSKIEEKGNSVANSASRKAEESVEVRKGNARCTIISEEILLDRKVKLCDKVTNAAPPQPDTKSAKHKKRRKNAIACGTSSWDVEEMKPVEKTADEGRNEKSKTSRLRNIDEMFDSLKDNFQRKADRQLEEAKKKKLTLKSKRKQEQKKKKQHQTKKREEENEDDEDIASLEFKNFNPKPILDEPLDEATATENVQQHGPPTLKTVTNAEQELVKKASNREIETDPDKYLNVKPKYLKTQLPDVTGEGEDALDNSEHEEETYRIMSEAFADDNVYEEFRKEKEEEIKNSQPEDVDLSLPGWGSWGGPNIKNTKRNKRGGSRRKKQTVILNAPKVAPRKDENKGKLIIFEDSNKKLKEHLVNELPYPFTTVKDFEASLRAPVSRTFISENAHLRLIQPAVETKIGQVIEPMDEDVLVKKKPIVKRPQKRGIGEKSGDKRSTGKNNKKRCK